MMHLLIDIKQIYRFEAQPISVHWNLSRLGRTLTELIGESWDPFPKKIGRKPMANQMSDAKNDSIETKSISAFPKRKVPLDFIFNAVNGENLVRELLKEFENYFIESFTEIMCRVRKFHSFYMIVFMVLIISI